MTLWHSYKGVSLVGIRQSRNGAITATGRASRIIQSADIKHPYVLSAHRMGHVAVSGVSRANALGAAVSSARGTAPPIRPIRVGVPTRGSRWGWNVGLGRY